MVSNLEIQKISIQPVKEIGIRSRVQEEKQKRIQIAITVKNNSPSTAFHVISNLQKMLYDSATKTLYAYLSDNSEHPNQGIEPIVRHRFLPSTVLIDPKESKVITISIPLVIKRIIGTQGGKLNMEILDISGLKKVVCRIAYNDKPLALEAPSHVDKIAKHIASWGKTTEKIFETKIPSEDGLSSSE